MKSLLKKVGFSLLVIIFLNTCVGTSPMESKSEVPINTENTNSYTIEAKVKNLFVNTLVIFTGTMFLAFDDGLTAMNEPLNSALSVEMDDAAISALDEQIALLDAPTMRRIERLRNNIYDAYDSIANVDRDIYEKIFLRLTMKEGVNIAERYDLPPGFRPLTEDLSFEEIKRYIVKISVTSDDISDVVIKSFEDIADWMQEVGQELARDGEIRTVVETIRK